MSAIVVRPEFCKLQLVLTSESQHTLNLHSTRVRTTQSLGLAEVHFLRAKASKSGKIEATLLRAGIVWNIFVFRKRKEILKSYKMPNHTKLNCCCQTVTIIQKKYFTTNQTWPKDNTSRKFPAFCFPRAPPPRARGNNHEQTFCAAHFSWILLAPSWHHAIQVPTDGHSVHSGHAVRSAPSGSQVELAETCHQIKGWNNGRVFGHHAVVKREILTAIPPSLGGVSGQKKLVWFKVNP